MIRWTMLTLCLAMPVSAQADACRDEIVALFNGPLDPFQRPPHSQRTQVLNADGSEQRVMLSLIETPMRTIAGQPSSNWFTMAIDNEIWNGPSPEGPWTANPAGFAGDRVAQMERILKAQIANLTDTECHGPDEAGNLRYTYRTQSDPDENGTYFGALDTITVDKDSGQVIHFDQTEFVNSWSEGVSMERWVIEVTFDPAIKVNPPGE
ncbi:MAG: hypothetical protein AAGP08_17845 [Pseudomonadota bacterium]